MSDICTPYTNTETKQQALQQAESEFFTTCFDRLMKHEGGYVNDPNDSGGETNWGVTKAVARKYGYTGSMRKLPKEIARDIAYQKYWKKVKADRFEAMGKPAVAWQLFDSAYNHGSGNAIRFLQRAVGVADDGIIGKVTLGAINERETDAIVLTFNAERLQFYTKLKSFKHFGRGWARRVADNLEYAAKDLVYQTTVNLDRGYDDE